MAGGFDEDVLLAIPKAQELADSEFLSKRFIDNIIIEGREMNGTVGNMADLRNLLGVPYRNVTVVGSQDTAIADLDAAFTSHASVGTLLGINLNKEIHESHSWARPQNNLTNAANGLWLDTALSNGTKIGDIPDADLDAYHDKGVVFVRRFPGYDGLYFSQSHVCAPSTDDFKNSELVEVIHEAIRLTYGVLVPLINSPVLVGSDGRIDIKQRKSIEADIRQVITTNMGSNISELKLVLIDPSFDQDNNPYPPFLSDNTLRAVIGIVPYGKAEQIIVTIGLTNA